MVRSGLAPGTGSLDKVMFEWGFIYYDNHTQRGYVRMIYNDESDNPTDRNVIPCTYLRKGKTSETIY